MRLPKTQPRVRILGIVHLAEVLVGGVELGLVIEEDAEAVVSVFVGRVFHQHVVENLLGAGLGRIGVLVEQGDCQVDSCRQPVRIEPARLLERLLRFRVVVLLHTRHAAGVGGHHGRHVRLWLRPRPEDVRGHGPTHNHQRQQHGKPPLSARRSSG